MRYTVFSPPEGDEDWRAMYFVEADDDAHALQVVFDQAVSDGEAWPAANVAKGDKYDDVILIGDNPLGADKVAPSPTEGDEGPGGATPPE